MYLAEKYGVLLPKEGPLRYDVLKWLFWGSTGFSGQCKIFGFYYFYCHHKLPYCVERYEKECKRLLKVLDGQLASHGKHWIVGELYSIADVAILPWVMALHNNYGDAIDAVFNSMRDYPHVIGWYDRCLARPATKRAVDVNTFIS